MHTFLVYAIVGCVLSMLLEIAFPNDLRPALLRSAFTLLQGTWFYHIGFILYPPAGWAAWKKEDHTQMMVVTMMFVWNLAAIVLFQLAVGFFCYRWIRRRMSLLGSKAICDDDDDAYDEDDAYDDDRESNGGGYKYNRVPQDDVTLNLLHEEE